jgi:pimeloyl-ACP methyl ester carboxylesterase
MHPLVSERQLEINNLHYALRCWGNPSYPTILAVHGWMDNAASFDVLAPHLAQHYYVIAVDLLGHGYSDARHPADYYHYLDMVIDLLGLIERLQCAPVIALGHSMGGSLLTLLAGLFPDRFLACISIDALGPLVARNLNMIDALRKVATAKYLQQQKSRTVYADLAAAVQARLLGGMAISEAAATILCARNLLPVPGGFIWRTDPRLRLPTLFKLSEPDVLAIFQQISCPFLLVAAEQGLLAQHFNIQSRLAALSAVQQVSFPGGHHLHLEDSAELVARSMLNFLQAHLV